jgi:hypothetical protein
MPRRGEDDPGSVGQPGRLPGRLVQVDATGDGAGLDGVARDGAGQRIGGVAYRGFGAVAHGGSIPTTALPVRSAPPGGAPNGAAQDSSLGARAGRAHRSRGIPPHNILSSAEADFREWANQAA